MKEAVERFAFPEGRAPRFFLESNPMRDRVPLCIEKILSFLRSIGAETWMDSSYREVFEGLPVGFSSREEALPEADILLSVGGDGTLLRSAKYAIAYGKPILGVNAGRLGFLTDLEEEDIPSLERLFAGGCELRRRMLLELIHGGESYIAVNDVHIAKKMIGRIVDLEVICDGREVSQYRADGLVFSTPNGSTAYSMSAGGPVVDREMQAIIMTPICPHSLISRSIVYSSEKVLTVQSRLVNNSDEVSVVVDGNQALSMNADDSITVRRSEKELSFVSVTGREFYEILNQKIIGRR